MFLLLPKFNVDNLKTDSSVDAVANSSQPNRTGTQPHYEQIGALLKTLEATYFKVGVPWLPPTKKISSLRIKKTEILEDYIRLELVNVPTLSLTSYVEDLEQKSIDENWANYFYLNTLSLFERLAFPFIAAALVLIVGFVTAIYLQVTIPILLLVGWVFPWITLLICLFMCLDGSRRSSFVLCLSQEIKRRQGADFDSLTKIPIYTVGGSLSK